MFWTGIEVNKPATVIVIVFIVFGLWYTISRRSSVQKSSLPDKYTTTSKEKENMYVRQTAEGKSTWLKDELKNLPRLNLKDSVVSHIKQSVTVDGKTIWISALESKPMNPKGTLLLLHGLHFSAKTWDTEGSTSTKPLLTIKTMASLGYHTVAIDLPGQNFRGDSGKIDVKDKDKGDCLAQIIAKFHLDSPVIVSPSMSGSFSLPFLFAGGKSCRGYVPVAPVGTDKFADTSYALLQVPTMIIYGERDGGASAGTEILRRIPASEVFMLKEARHPAYLDQPDAFHKLLYNFLSAVFSDGARA